MKPLTSKEKRSVKSTFKKIEEKLQECRNSFDLSYILSERECGTTACFLGWETYLYDRVGVENRVSTTVFNDNICRERSNLFDELTYVRGNEEATLQHFPNRINVHDITFEEFRDVFYEKFGIK